MDIKTVEVTANALNVRSSRQKKDGNIIGVVHKGDILDEVGKSAKWTEVKFNDLHGYVMNEFVKNID